MAVLCSWRQKKACAFFPYGEKPSTVGAGGSHSTIKCLESQALRPQMGIQTSTQAVCFPPAHAPHLIFHLTHGDLSRGSDFWDLLKMGWRLLDCTIYRRKRKYCVYMQRLTLADIAWERRQRGCGSNSENLER